MSYKFTSGMLVLVQGDKKEEWFTALDWQYRNFIRVMRFGTMKSMGRPTPLEKTEVFKHNNFKYRFHIHNDWGPCFIENMITKKIREIKYFEIGISAHENSIKPAGIFLNKKL